MDFKLVAASIGAALVILAYVPYVIEILRGNTKPHLYTWTIWFLTLAIALLGMWYGGARISALGYLPSLILVCIIIGLSLRYGTTNVTRSDALALIASILAIAVWVFLNNPLLSVLMVTAIDAIGYYPTARKSFSEPWSENISTWILFTMSAMLLFYAIEVYSLQTSIYLAVTIVANVILIGLIVVRRLYVPRLPL